MVVGTSANIGAGIALGVAAAGASVACIDRDTDNASACAANIVAQGGTAVGMGCDVTDEPAVERALATVRREFGVVDALVNGATRYDEQGVVEMPLDRWRAQLDTILTGAFLMTKHVARELLTTGRQGAIVNIASTAAHQGEPNNVGYSTAKAGLLNFTRSVAMELASRKIRVNSLTPTSTDPSESFEREREWGRRIRDDTELETFREFFGKLARRVPLQQLPLPADYAEATVFLLSDAARMITGVDLRVDAGTVAKYWRWEPGQDQRPPGSVSGAEQR